MWDDCAVSTLRSFRTKCNATQSQLHEHVVTSAVRTLECLSDKTTYSRLERAPPSHPDLKASLVVMSHAASTCDSMSMVGPLLYSSVLDHGGVFRDVAGHRSVVPYFTGAPRREYVQLTSRSFYAGKLHLYHSVCAGGTGFAVKKPSAGQREVWHGQYVSSLCSCASEI